MHRNGYIIISFHQKEETKHIRGDFERSSEWGRMRGGGKIRSKMTRCKILYACTLLKEIVVMYVLCNWFMKKYTMSQLRAFLFYPFISPMER